MASANDLMNHMFRHLEDFVRAQLDVESSSTFRYDLLTVNAKATTRPDFGLLSSMIDT